MTTKSSADLAQEVINLVSVEQIGEDKFVASAAPDEHQSGAGRVYGGLVVAQALAAAEATVPTDRPPGSFQCRFLRPGNESKPIHYRVERDLDGGSFTHRRVVADQDGKPILTCSIMFHRGETGIAHQPPMPEVSSPEEIRAELLSRHRSGEKLSAALNAFLIGPSPIELVPVNPEHWDPTIPSDAPVQSWIRIATPLSDEPRLHRAILAYASDMALLQAADVRHGLSWFRGEINQPSLDHAIWFHDDFRADEWLLYVTESPWAGRGRALTRGQIFASDGRLVASTTQEGLIRLLKPAA